ncbi:MAG: hypothetical protein AB9M60_00365 [Leptothrix sp. (in: b-proteobacteria)]
MTALRFTIYTAEHPPRLTKIMSLDEAGHLVKKAGADMQRGQAEHKQVSGLDALAVELDALAPNQAVSWGVPKGTEPGAVLGIVTKDAHLLAPSAGAVPRDRAHLAYPSGPGVMMIDHDGGHAGERLDLDELRARLIEACPALAGAPMLWRPSASAGITAPDGRELTGLHKHRIYIPVSRAADIPAAGQRLMTLLWAADKAAPGRHAWAEVGKAGQVLLRGLLDAQVWQPERLDFAAAPVLQDGLSRPGAAARVFGDPLALFDLAEIRSDADTDKAAAAAQKAVRKALAPQAAAAREKWADEKAPELVQRRGIPVEKARTILLRAAGDTRVLMGDFELITSTGERVTVGTVLDFADRWHNARFADPLDPDEDRRVASVNLKSGGRPFLWTHRHGGIRFELRRQSARVQVGAGRRIEATDAVLQVLRDRSELFEFGEGAVAYVAEGKARPVSPDWLNDHMGRVCEFYRLRKKEDAQGNVVTEESPEDPPGAISRAILAKHGSRGFSRLVGVVTAPTLRPDGSILDKPGHDADSGLFYWCDHPTPPTIAERVTPAQALDALRVLWEPIRLFPLVDDVARGVALHGLLTAAIRASLPTAPGIGFDAPAAGSGKTLLARCIGILATGTEPAILPPADTDEETRKRLFAALREGHRVILWDNVREPLGNAALDSFLTAATFADRILGSSETASLPNRALFICSGNNMRLSSDTCRRVLLARMDAESETPYTRDFSFDPAQAFYADRLRYIGAALSIIRAHITAGRPKVAKGRTASFETWDDLVRQPLCWLAGLVTAHNEAHPGDRLPTFTDPMKAAALAFEADPETMKHGALLEAWHAEFLDMPTTVAAAIRRAETAEDLLNALDEIGGQGGRVNVRITGRWLDRLQGRIINGKLFRRGSRGAAGQTWMAKKVRDPGQNDSTDSTHSTKPGASGGLKAGFSAVSADSAVISERFADPHQEIGGTEVEL